ncbi:cupin [Methanoculleus taiwanensis]|uniref:Cupin n=1 Tax=Methanoculleus taiwanensis TaxID=1550565 RepID=A0A498H154_9EURY|nr:cupin domain-containing protein [Methanoculleus taiwanensis]RXE56393.1 cupin [Methanoculleus taiwanensis]
MEQKNVLDIFDQGVVFLPDLEIMSAEKPWYPHPEWKGVFLKDLVTGKETGGAFSYHLVRVWKNHEVMDHNHETQWEWNRIIDGTGVFLFEDKEIPLADGQTFVTPPGVRHAVSAHHEDLSLLAVFVPALV